MEMLLALQELGEEDSGEPEIDEQGGHVLQRRDQWIGSGRRIEITESCGESSMFQGAVCQYRRDIATKHTAIISPTTAISGNATAILNSVAI